MSAPDNREAEELLNTFLEQARTGQTITAQFAYLVELVSKGLEAKKAENQTVREQLNDMFGKEQVDYAIQEAAHPTSGDTAKEVPIIVKHVTQAELDAEIEEVMSECKPVTASAKCPKCPKCGTGDVTLAYCTDGFRNATCRGCGFTAPTPTSDFTQFFTGATALPGAAWLVWSHEHGCWWRANKCGYTTNIADAGRYTLEAALACCDLRSRQPDGTPSEIVQPSPEWVAAALASLSGEGK